MKLTTLLGQTLVFSNVIATSSSTEEPVKMAFQKSFKKDDGALSKRDSQSLLMDFQTEGIYYLINVSVGTPEQPVTVALDTGSSDFWVMGANNPYCSSNTDKLEFLGISEHDCTYFGTFDPEKSETYVPNIFFPPFEITYGNTEFAKGEWGFDTLTVGGVEIPGSSVAIGEESNSSIGIFGIGLKGLESTNVGSISQGLTYTSFPYQLIANNLTTRNIYSLYTTDLGAASGEILFGAVDTAKFASSLYTVPLVNTVPQYIPSAIMFEVELQGIGFVDDEGVQNTISSQRMPTLLDSGAYVISLPSVLFETLAPTLNLVPGSADGIYLLPCLDSSSTAYFAFDFGGFQINVPLNNFVVPTNEEGTCAFLIVPQDNQDGSAIFGDLFMANAYIVYDLDNLEVSLGQAVFTDESNIEVVSSAIPSAIRAPGYSSTFAGYDSTSREPLTHDSVDIFTVSSVVTPSGIPLSHTFTPIISDESLEQTFTANNFASSRGTSLGSTGETTVTSTEEALGTSTGNTLRSSTGNTLGTSTGNTLRSSTGNTLGTSTGNTLGTSTGNTLRSSTGNTLGTSTGTSHGGDSSTKHNGAITVGSGGWTYLLGMLGVIAAMV